MYGVATFRPRVLITGDNSLGCIDHVAKAASVLRASLAVANDFRGLRPSFSGFLFLSNCSKPSWKPLGNRRLNSPCVFERYPGCSRDLFAARSHFQSEQACNRL